MDAPIGRREILGGLIATHGDRIAASRTTSRHHHSNSLSELECDHLLLFLGRITFIFGGSLFAVVFFRHLPEIDQGADIWLMVRRGLQLVASLFALFCVTLELERLGRAFGSSQQSDDRS